MSKHKFKVDVELEDSRYCNGCKMLGLNIVCEEFEETLDVEGLQANEIYYNVIRLPECIKEHGGSDEKL